jgi:DNA-binding phage protein
MNPKQAIKALQARGWSVIQIADKVGMNRANVYKAMGANHLPSYLNGVALVELAQSRRKPPRKEKVA